MSAKPSYAGNGAYPDSYYAASRNIERAPTVLEGDIQADVAVLGAGYSGLSTAIHLAEKGYKVAVVEGARVGWGASGRNGGQIVNGLNASLDTIRRRYGEEAGASSAAWCRKAAGSSAASFPPTASIAT